MASFSNFAVMVGAVASGIFVYNSLDLGNTLSRIAHQSKETSEAGKDAEDVKDDWGQDTLTQNLSNKTELEFNLFFNEQPKDTNYTYRTTSIKIMADDTNVVYENTEGTDFKPHDDSQQVISLEETYLTDASLSDRRPYDEIDYTTQQPLNWIKDDFYAINTTGLEEVEADPVETKFDPYDTYNNQPLFHAEEQQILINY